MRWPTVAVRRIIKPDGQAGQAGEENDPVLAELVLYSMRTKMLARKRLEDANWAVELKSCERKVRIL